MRWAWPGKAIYPGFKMRKGENEVQGEKLCCPGPLLVGDSLDLNWSPFLNHYSLQ